MNFGQENALSGGVMNAGTFAGTRLGQMRRLYSQYRFNPLNSRFDGFLARTILHAEYSDFNNYHTGFTTPTYIYPSKKPVESAV